MYKPGSMGTKAETASKDLRKDLRRDYQEKKLEYLELCWQYNLPPRDLSLLLMGNPDILAPDRIKLIRLIIALSRIEQSLGPRLADHLFASDETSYNRSAIFRQGLN
jgi:hypothetical protein